MSTENRSLFHCVKCGRVADVVPGSQAPECCGKAMTMAVSETAHGDEGCAERERRATPVESRA